MSRELHARREALELLWRQGLTGRALLNQHTQLVDGYLIHRFQESRKTQAGIALIALGGYGRGELFPFSDIDIMFLYDPSAEGDLETITEAVLYPLWDAGLEVGHSVRTVAACLTDAENDFFFQVAMLDARFLTGDDRLFSELKENFRKIAIEGHRRNFLANMLRNRHERLKHYGEHSYLLEPNIKECRGGLRDIHSMLWTAWVIFGMKQLLDIEEAGLFSVIERQRFETSWDNLIRIRNRLHYISGRKNDQLHFEHQEEMSKALDIQDKDGILGVERFMREVHTNLNTIATAVDIFFEHADETIGLTEPSTANRVLKPGISIRHGRIHLADRELLAEQPDYIMQLFSLSAKTALPLHYWTRKLVSANRHLIDDKLRSSRSMARYFLDIMLEGVAPEQALSALLDTGILTAYLPEFAHLESLVQHDIYHIFTVDRHLLKTVGELFQLRTEQERLFKKIRTPHVLFLAALLHDIGKASGHDHAERGAELAYAISYRLGFSETDRDSLGFLIRKHLVLLTTAQRRDLEDEILILRCAGQMKDLNHLTMLYLLSIADARATGPTAWNEWKAALLLEFYLKVANLLGREDEIEPDHGHAVEWMRGQVEKLLGTEAAEIRRLLPDAYLIGFSAETIARHFAWRAKLAPQNALIFPEESQGYWTITVLAQDSTGLLAKICGVLALHNMHVVNAQIHTWLDGTALDVFIVQPHRVQYEVNDWETLEKDLNLALQNRLGLSHRLAEKYRSNCRPHKPVGNYAEPLVVIDNKISEAFTVIEVFSEEKPGLLYALAKTLADFGLNISQAKISTARDQAVDVFYTQDNNAAKISNPGFQEEIRQALLFAIGATNNGIKC